MKSEEYVEVLSRWGFEWDETKAVYPTDLQCGFFNGNTTLETAAVLTEQFVLDAFPAQIDAMIDVIESKRIKSFKEAAQITDTVNAWWMGTVAGERVKIKEFVV